MDPSHSVRCKVLSLQTNGKQSRTRFAPSTLATSDQPRRIPIKASSRGQLQAACPVFRFYIWSDEKFLL